MLTVAPQGTSAPRGYEAPDAVSRASSRYPPGRGRPLGPSTGPEAVEPSHSHRCAMRRRRTRSVSPT